MKDSIQGKAFALAFAVSAPPAVLAQLYARSTAVRVASLLAALVAIVAAWLFSRSLARRLRDQTSFVDRLLDPGAPRRRLQTSNDELGNLARSLSRIAPRIDELVGRLSTELTRREAVLATMTEAVLAVDAHLNVTFCNNAFIKVVGDHGLAEGLPLLKIVRDPGLFAILRRVLDSGEPLSERLQLPTSESRSFDVYAAPLASAPSRGAIAILHDVTPAERLERVKRDFIANVSHEIRTPLATIRGYAETLLDGGLDDWENRRKFVEIIQANAVRLNNIAADLISLSELESGPPAALAGPISLHDVLTGAIRAIEPAASLMGVRVKADTIPDLELLGYGIRLEQAFLNLLDNAVKFNRADGEVRVHVEPPVNEMIEIRISDTGVGIPAEDQSRIFERFYRVDKARSRQVGGTGLGLSIVKHAIEQMNGTIAVESEPGRGSTFIVRLPQYRRQ